MLRDILPTILSVIQPTLRPVNKQLFSAKEKQELANVVAVHIAYNITYQQEKNMDTGGYDYRMDPDVEGVVCFPNTRRLTNLSYGTKQLISHEIELERMRRIDVAKAEFSSEEGSQGTPSKPLKEATIPTGMSANLTPKGSKKTTNHLATLAAKPVQLKTVQPTDFFGRAIKVMSFRSEVYFFVNLDPLIFRWTHRKKLRMLNPNLSAVTSGSSSRRGTATPFGEQSR